MSTRHVRQLRRAGVATLMAAAIAFSATACGGDDDKPSGNSSSSSAQGNGGSKGSDGPTTDPNSKPVVATIKGDSGINMLLHEVKRDNGGFLTLSGEFKNTSSESFVIPTSWIGSEKAIVEAVSGRSLAAMTLVDAKGKKRYYVLRDTDNRPLTTTNFEPVLHAGDSMSFFAQFPSPPASTGTVELQFPGFPDSPIEIS